VLDDEGRLEKVVAAHDVGRALNPTLIEGQIEGGVHMGLGQALSEEFRRRGRRAAHRHAQVAPHHPPTGNAAVECILVEETQPEGPYGAKGVGEAALVADRSRGRRRAVRCSTAFRRTNAADEGLAGGGGGRPATSSRHHRRNGA